MTFRPSTHRPGTTFDCPACEAQMDCRCPVIDLTTAEAARLADVSARTAQSWRRDGLAGPSVPVPPIEVELHYGFIDLMTLRFVNALRQRSCPTWLLKSNATEFQESQINFRSLLDTDVHLWALAPVDADLGETTKARFGRTLMLLPHDEADGLGRDEMWLSFDCHSHASAVDHALEEWHQARGLERPTWA